MKTEDQYHLVVTNGEVTLEEGYFYLASAFLIKTETKNFLVTYHQDKYYNAY